MAAAPSDELRSELEQVDFFLQQSLHDEARAVLDELAQRFPGDPADRREAAAIARAERAATAAPVAGAGRDSRRRAAAATIPHGPVAKLSASERADPGTHGDLGIAYKQMGLYDAAIAEFKLLQADRTRAVFALTMIGECVEAKGELGEAVGRYKEALNLSAGDAARNRWSSTTCWDRCSSAWATCARRSTSSRTCASATPRSATSCGGSPR